jgi:biopolymer transport protein ExbD
MRRIQSRLRVLSALVALLLILGVPASFNAQRRKPIPTPPAKPPAPDSSSSTPPNLRSASQASLEMDVLMSRRSLIGDLERERRRMASQLARDLEQLEQLNADRIVPLASAATLDYKNLAQLTADVKTRANRIKFNSPVVLIDRTGEKIRYDADASQLATMLPQLSRAVTKFVGNPVFRISAPNDAELRSTAAHDLEDIIKLSDAINKIAKRLGKALVASR